MPFRPRFENCPYRFGPNSSEIIVTVLRRRAINLVVELLPTFCELAVFGVLTWLARDRPDSRFPPLTTPGDAE